MHDGKAASRALPFRIGILLGGCAALLFFGVCIVVFRRLF